MEMTLAEIKIKSDVLNSMANLKMPYGLAKAVAQNLLELQTDLKLIEDKRLELVEKYSDKDESGNPMTENGCFKISDEQRTLFEADYGMFLTETKTDINVHKISEDVLEQLSDKRYDAVTPRFMIELDFMVEKGGN